MRNTLTKVVLAFTDQIRIPKQQLTKSKIIPDELSLLPRKIPKLQHSKSKGKLRN